MRLDEIRRFASDHHSPVVRRYLLTLCNGIEDRDDIIRRMVKYIERWDSWDSCTCPRCAEALLLQTDMRALMGRTDQDGDGVR